MYEIENSVVLSGKVHSKHLQGLWLSLPWMNSNNYQGRVRLFFNYDVKWGDVLVGDIIRVEGTIGATGDDFVCVHVSAVKILHTHI